MTSKDSDVSLLSFLDLQQTTCLNESPEHTFKSIVSNKTRNTSDAYLQSDADEQLLINITFTQALRIRSIVLHTSTENKDHAPKTIKLAVNNPSIGFDDLEGDANVAQEIELSEEDVEGKEVQLRYVRFQRVNSLHIFVASNQGDEDETRIDKLDVFGVPVEATKDLGGLRNQEHDHDH